MRHSNSLHSQHDTNTAERCMQMEEIKEVLKKIDELRKKINDMINASDDLLDSNIIDLSRLLDEQLTEYYRLLKKMNT